MPTSCSGPIWADHIDGAQRFGVSHLHPVIRRIDIPGVPPGPGKPGRAPMSLPVRFSYSHHCFTQSRERAPGATADQTYTCTQRPHEDRVFCPVRWRESKALPKLLSTLQACYFTRHHNYFVVEDPTDPSLGEYFVYFSVRRNRRHALIDVFVESAYPGSTAIASRAATRRASTNC